MLVLTATSYSDGHNLTSQGHVQSGQDVNQKRPNSNIESQIVSKENQHQKKFKVFRRQHNLSHGINMKSTYSSITDVMSLSSISSTIKENVKPSFLVSIKPDNYRAEKTRFMQSNFNYNPYFVYFCPVSSKKMQKYRTPSNKYMSVAVLIMKRVIAQFGSYENYEEMSGGRLLTRDEIISVVDRYLMSDELIEQIHINLCDDLISCGSLTRVKGETILNVRCVNMRENWAEGLLRHEIGTHYIRSNNNHFQPWYKTSIRNELKMGPKNPTEEGLASLHSVLFRTEPYLWRAALLYYTIYMASKMSFRELFRDLGKFVKSPNVRWEYCLRAKRGQEWTCRPGCFSKDQVYLEGAIQLLKRRKVLDFQLLIRLGKVSFEDVDRPCITSIARLTDTRIPYFMEDMPVYLQSLDHIASTNGLTESVLNSADRRF